MLSEPMAGYHRTMRWLLCHLVIPSLLGLLVATLITPLSYAEQGSRYSRYGWIEIVSSTMGAEVVVDGEQVGTVPIAEKVQVSVGEHSVKVAKRGYTQHLEVVRVKLRQTVTINANLLALSGVLRVEANVEDARVFVDEEYIGNVPVEQEVEPGSREVKVRLLGYHDFRQTIDVVAGEETTISAELERLPPEEDPTIVEPPDPPRWYERWWVWTIVGTVVVSLAVVLPVVLTREDDHCEQQWGDHGIDSCDDDRVISPVIQ